jgi:hypothetical protein
MPDEKNGQPQTSPSVASRARIQVPYVEVAQFARRNHIRKLSLFGSVLRDDFRPESDIDVLVEFHPEHIPGFITLAGMEHQLSDILGGRKIDMNTPKSLSIHFRDEVLDEAEVIYDEGQD